MADDMGSTAVVFGLGPAGLALARTLARAGRAVYAVCRPDDIGKYSNSVCGFMVARDAGEVLGYLRSLRNVAPEGKLEGWIASDQYLTMILKHRGDFEAVLSFHAPDLDFLSDFNDKESAFDNCLAVGINVPKRIALSALKACLDRADFPLVVKPRVKNHFSIDDGVGKIRVINNKSEFEKMIESIEACGAVLTDYECEPFIAGDNWNEIGYGGYASAGRMLADVAVRQFKQYPQGVACAAVEVTDQSLFRRIQSEAQKLISSYNYSGFIHFDMKIDDATGSLYVLDVNPRAWGSVAVLLRQYPEIAKCLSNRVMANSVNGYLYWHSPLKEMLAKGNPLNTEIDSSAKGECVRVLDIWDARDPKPFFMQPIIGIEIIISRLRVTKR